MSTDRPDPSHALIALLAEQARRGPNTCVPILDMMMTVPDEFISSQNYPVWTKMKELAGNGSPPTVLALRRALPTVSPDYWTNLRTDEASIPDARDAVLHDAQRKRYVKLHSDLRGWITSGRPFSEINHELSTVVDESLVGSPEPTRLSGIDFMARVEQIKAGTIPMIETPWPVINAGLGGGLYTGGDLAMTAIVAYSGVGKTRVAQQINVVAGAAGHRILVFAGESNATAYALGLAQIVGYIPRNQMSPKYMTEDTVNRLRDAQDTVRGMGTSVYDKRFDPELIRAVMSREARQLKQDKTTGRAAPHAQLLVIIDNIDHAVNNSGDKAWQELEQSAKAIYNTAQRVDAHVIVLAQAKAEGFHEGYPPTITGFARATLIASHCSNILGLYRPVTYAQRNAGSGDIRLVPKVSINKSRAPGGFTDTINFAVDETVGLWTV